MSTPNMFWFHCGRCGSMFESRSGDEEARRCAKCGSDPGTGILDAPAEPVATREIQAPEPERRSGHQEHRGKRSGKRRKNSHFMLKLVAGWSLVLALIIFGARQMWHDDAPEKPPATTTQKGAPVESGENVLFVDDNMPKAAEALFGFLASSTPEERNQFVLNPIATVSRMARFEGLNPLVKVDPKTIALERKSFLKLPVGKAIETLWKTQDGRILDAVFRKEDDEWRLDWEHFVRYSDYPWSLFLAGSGDPEGEFRLLARERQVEERADKETTISLVLYAPRFGAPDETGFQSPEFLVSRNTRDGQLLDAAFKLARSGGQVFDSKLPNTNSEGMIRVRVKVRRSEEEAGRKFEISKVIACHWYSADEPGVEPLPPAESTAPIEAKPQER